MTSVSARRAGEPSDQLPVDVDRQLLDIFFGQAPVAAALFDRDYRLQRCNANWTALFVDRLGVPADRVQPGRSLLEVMPGADTRMVPILAPVLAGQTTRQTAHRIASAGNTSYWDVVFAPTFQDGAVVGFVAVAVDATERVTANELLQRRIAAFAAVASSSTVDQPIDVTLRALAETAVGATGADACAIVIVDEESNLVSLFAAAGLPAEYGDAVAESWRLGVQSPSRDALETQQLTVVPDARAKGLANPLYAPLYPYLRDAGWEDMVIVPLDSRGRCLGVMQYYHQRGRQFDDDELAFLTALADQAALAVANAALYATSERDAALLERQRLARELHDSVSQALFSMTLHARTAERQLLAEGISPDAPPAATVRRLADLTQGALAEMRALIFELRPGALAEEGLVTALTRQAAALSAREGVPINVSGPADRPVLDPAVEEHLYRLVLEALNNAVRHASASRITVAIAAATGSLRLTVTDDGVGFDPSQPAPGHLGQVTMAERATTIGAELEVLSSPGAGCTVTVTLPATR